ncbi:MAG: citrate transporter [Ruminococcaceae bacterium]|nr:citrate transporter [Oscillospiraceae bacterium]
MQKLLAFFKKEAVLSIAGLAALISLFFVPVDAGYLTYIDFGTLATLTALMLVVAGLTEAGVFRVLADRITGRMTSPRGMILMLVLLCFFLSALITNDVALITFVPFTIGLLGTRDQRRLIFVIVTETVAANLGSLLTPMGNPQNLLLYHHFGLGAGEFLLTMLPLGGVSLALCLMLVFLCPRGEQITQPEDTTALDRKNAFKWGLLFLLCVCGVAGLIEWWFFLPVVALAAVLTNPRLFREVDYSLLLTFVFFFIFVGNMARIEPVSAFLRDLLTGREVLVGALTSQVISNVPAAAMLASFTEDARGLLYGVNIGGLGTIIASMASLISYRRYCAAEGAEKGRYMAVFSVVNVVGLAILLFIFG